MANRYGNSKSAEKETPLQEKRRKIWQKKYDNVSEKGNEMRSIYNILGDKARLDTISESTTVKNLEDYYSSDIEKQIAKNNSDNLPKNDFKTKQQSPSDTLINKNKSVDEDYVEELPTTYNYYKYILGGIGSLLAGTTASAAVYNTKAMNNAYKAIIEASKVPSNIVGFKNADAFVQAKLNEFNLGKTGFKRTLGKTGFKRTLAGTSDALKNSLLVGKTKVIPSFTGKGTVIPKGQFNVGTNVVKTASTLYPKNLVDKVRNWYNPLEPEVTKSSGIRGTNTPKETPIPETSKKISSGQQPSSQKVNTDIVEQKVNTDIVEQKVNTDIVEQKIPIYDDGVYRPIEQTNRKLPYEKRIVKTEKTPIKYKLKNIINMKYNPKSGMYEQGIVHPEFRKFMNMPKSSLNLGAGVGAFGALTLNEILTANRDNPDRSALENTGDAITNMIDPRGIPDMLRLPKTMVDNAGIAFNPTNPIGGMIKGLDYVGEKGRDVMTKGMDYIFKSEEERKSDRKLEETLRTNPIAREQGVIRKGKIYNTTDKKKVEAIENSRVSSGSDWLDAVLYGDTNKKGVDALERISLDTDIPVDELLKQGKKMWKKNKK